MRKIMVIAVREYQAAVKTKAFIIGLLMMPLIWGSMVVIQILLKDKVDTKDKPVAVLDYTGEVYGAIAAAAAQRNEKEIYDERGEVRRQVLPRILVEQTDLTSEPTNEAALALSERVRRGELYAFVVIGPDAIHGGPDPTRAAINYYSNSPTNEDVLNWISRPINMRVQDLRFAAAELDADTVRRATVPLRLANLGLVSVDVSGTIQDAQQTNRIANFMVPLGSLMLMFMVIMIGASPLMQSVLEEKMQRIAEVLLGSVTPFQLMMGKLLGMVGVSLTIATIYLVGGFLALKQSGYSQFFPAHVIWWFVVFQALAVLMYGSVFIAIGAAVTDLKDAQNIIGPVMMVVVVPMVIWHHIIKEPLSTLATAMSLFPPFTPMLMIVRQSVPPGIPVWQPILGVVLVILMTTLLVFAAGRIFRVGLLMQGRGAKLTEMLRWAIRG